MATQLDVQSRSRILAIEPDPVRASTLQRLLSTYVKADFEIVKSVTEALQAVGERVPDLVLTSTFLPPADENALTDSLKLLASAGHVQVINVPHFIDCDDDVQSEPASKVLNFLRRRSVLSRPVCDPRTVRDQIEHYLERARNEKLDASGGEIWKEIRAQAAELATQQAAGSSSLVRRLTSEDVYTLANGAGPRTHKLGRVHSKDRRRATRRPSDEIPWLTAVRMPWGLEARVVNISTSGILLESPSKIQAGGSVDLQLLGSSAGVTMPARLIRSEVASVNALGVKYRIAAAFDRELDILPGESQPSTAGTTPKALADLLVRVFGDVALDSPSRTARIKFQDGLRGLLPVRDVQIRLASGAPNSDEQSNESVYFRVPQASGPGAVLQVTFDPNHQPSANEFKLLKAAAGMAAAVLEFSPLDESAPRL